MRIIIAGGGTGGHLFPGIAIADAFTARDQKNRVLFVSTGKPFEISVLSKTVFKHKSITAEGIKGRGLWKQAVSVLKIPKGIFESIMILKDFRPDIVVGVGGYSAGSVVIAAWLMGIKIVLHEQNILPGITNRILSGFADRIYVSFKDTRLERFRWLALVDPKKLLVSGNPVRKEILQSAMDQQDVSLDDTGQKKPFTVLILGGSQGAHSINMAVLEAFEYLEEKDKYFFVHQTGSADEQEVKRAYMKSSISCMVKSFFDDMARQYHNADLVVCRAGATTVAEVAVMGKGVIFIPYPFAADNHQVLNAGSLENERAAEMILQKDLTGKKIAKRIEHYASSPEALKSMASRAKSIGRPDAAETIVDDCYRLIEGLGD
ncbi:MAG: undecaprenyldiphospho-muramoylpentapeptide beta-N-acetylglucosaminyltransferase [Desulfobacteraceae bacterium]|nr:undecaprenyldiphospho-muramoylpentapeptide beta-N-acetylglucosaminyltransferase [Desulfobacteraceae bacterium]